MNRYNLLLLACFAIIVFKGCQNSPKTTLESVSFDEPQAPQLVTPMQDWNALENSFNVSWGSSNERYHKEYIPNVEVSQNHTITGWRNERLNAQMVVWCNDSLFDLNIQVTDLKSNNAIIKAEAIKSYFVRNVLADEFLGGCGYKTKSLETAHLVADCLEEVEAYNMRSQSARGIWFTIDIPKDAVPGTYTAEVSVGAKDKKAQLLKLNVEVLARTLPNPTNWTYHLDLWQNPYASARVHNVELWSEQHFTVMKPLFEILANAGQKCITASILHRPWGGQSLDEYQSMIKHTFNSNGEWEFDYSIFDKWVSYMMDLGIKNQINCYSLIPWGNQLWYFDEKMGIDTFMVAEASSLEFANYWTPFLKDFSLHLKNKEWFEITTIAMDERPLKAMVAAIGLINEHSGLKITSAANYAPGTSEHIYDLSVEARHILPDEVLAERKLKGQKTTYYVCCSAEFPNNFTYSPPAEGVWQGWYAFAKKQDGFLRWAYNSWVEEPLLDTRFRTWPAGDTFFIYPGPKSSIRWEKLREGIQDYEKLRIVVKELKDSSSTEAQTQLHKIEELLKDFEVENIRIEGAQKAILNGKKVLNAQW